MKKNPLWLWIGLRMSLLAVAAALVITGCMSLYFWVDELQTESTMTAEDHATYNAALTDIDANHAVLWRLIEKYYDLKDFLPGGADNSDWWALFMVVTGVLPLISL